MDFDLFNGRFRAKKLTGAEEFKNTGGRQFSILGLWQYGCSNFQFNLMRGMVAEFIVLNALLDDVGDDARDPTKGFDFLYRDKKIEVKGASYLQDFGEKRHTEITWSDLKAQDLYQRPTTKLDPNGHIAYPADIYVLALLVHTDYPTLDILDVRQWCFYVLSRERLRKICGDLNYLPIYKLDRHGATPVSFSGLHSAVDACFKDPS